MKIGGKSCVYFGITRSTTWACVLHDGSTRPWATVTLYFQCHMTTTSYTAQSHNHVTIVGDFAYWSRDLNELHDLDTRPYTSTPHSCVTSILQFCLNLCEMFQYGPYTVPNLFKVLVCSIETLFSYLFCQWFVWLCIKSEIATDVYSLLLLKLQLLLFAW